MITGLASTVATSVELVVPSGTCSVHASAYELAKLPLTQLPLSRRLLSALWAGLVFPPIRWWVSDAEWVYCPRELSVAPGRCRYAMTVHDLWPLDRGQFGLKDRIKWKWLLGRALRRADLILTVSDFTSDRICEWFGPLSDKIRVVGNGASPAFFEPTDTSNAPLDERLVNQRYLIAVGGITWKKGGDRLLALADHMSRSQPDLRLVVVGPIEPRFATNPLPTNIVHLQRGMDDVELARLVRAAKISVSLSRYEGFGITLAEAMAVGTPVVASDIPPHREVAGDAAVLVDASDVELLGRKVDEMLDHEDRRMDYAARGVLRAAHFTWSNAVDRLSAALREFS